MTQCFGLFDTTACLLLLLWNDRLLLGQTSAQAFLMAHTSSLQLFLLMQKKKKKQRSHHQQGNPEKSKV